jgi:hypothetical protein
MLKGSADISDCDRGTNPPDQITLLGLKGQLDTARKQEHSLAYKKHQNTASSRQRLAAIHDITDLYTNFSSFTEHPTLPNWPDSLTISSVQVSVCHGTFSKVRGWATRRCSCASKEF